MIRIRTTLFETRPPEASIRAWRTISREAHADMGELWHRKFLPRHFQDGSRTKYRHKKRSPKYNRWKRRMAGRRVQGGTVQRGGRVDNVLTGQLEKAMKSAATIRPFPSRVTIQMFGPRYITMRPFKSNQPDKAAEITQVTAEESQQLADALDWGLAKRHEKLVFHKTTRS